MEAQRDNANEGQTKTAEPREESKQEAYRLRFLENVDTLRVKHGAHLPRRIARAIARDVARRRELVPLA